MRRHAKASTAGSTQRQAGRLGRFFRGALAGRASSPRVPGSSAPSARRPAPARGIFGLACLAILALAALFAGGASSAVADEECPNEIRRQEQGVLALALPECRAYEDVSPGGNPRASSNGAPSGIQAAPSGNAVGYLTVYPNIGAERSGEVYLTTREASGWNPRTIMPQETPETTNVNCGAYAYFSRDLSKNIYAADQHLYTHSPGDGINPAGYCEHNEDVLDAREVRGWRNVFTHDISSDGYELVSLNEDEGALGNSRFLVGSDDLSTIVFSSEALLTSDAPDVPETFGRKPNVFVWSGGRVRLATYLPDGTPVQATLPSVLFTSYTFGHTLSTDGSHLLFNYGGALYVRVNPAQPQSALSGGECTEPAKACTYQVDESQGPGASGGGIFEFASEDGSRIFFMSDRKLTAGSTAVAGKEDLYEYDVETGDLTDLTVNAAEPANVWALSDASQNGDYLYFVAETALEGTEATTPGSCEHYLATSTCNLYVDHNGTITYIAALSVDDTSVFKGERFFGGPHNGHVVQHHGGNLPHAESSANGRYFIFETAQDLTGEGTGLYVYDALTQELHRLCSLGGEDGIDPIAGIDAGGEGARPWRRNNVLDNGTVFFATDDALAPNDVNEQRDVYEYRDGETFLLSSGKDPSRSDFSEATLSGSDAYFITGGALVPADTEGGLTIYDARIGGGFDEAPPLPGCESEACRGAGTNAPAAAATGSAAFQGAGNQKQGHKRDCGLAAKRAQKVSRAAKSLRRQAKSAQDPKQAKRLLQRSAKLAKKGRQLSKGAKRCRRANRGTGK